ADESEVPQYSSKKVFISNPIGDIDIQLKDVAGGRILGLVDQAGTLSKKSKAQLLANQIRVFVDQCPLVNRAFGRGDGRGQFFLARLILAYPPTGVLINKAQRPVELVEFRDRSAAVYAGSVHLYDYASGSLVSFELEAFDGNVFQLDDAD